MAVVANAGVIPVGVWGPGWPYLAAPVSYTAHTAPLAIAQTLVATGPTVVAGHPPTVVQIAGPAPVIDAPALVPVVAAEG